jgi:O-antigen/teichoic acid export membrane protein
VTRALLGKSGWVLGGFVVTYGLRFGLNVVYTRLLAPEIMGIMVILNAVRLGIELLTDVGIEQNIIHHHDGLTPQFRNAAWTMQVGRGVLLSTVFVVATPFLSAFYHVPAAVFYVAAASPVLGGLHSTAVFVLVRQLEVSRRNLFEVGSEGLGFAVSVGLTMALRSVWGPVIGLVAAVAIRSALSYLLPDSGQRLVLDRVIQRRIFAFGKWIALTSLLMYAASNLDRLYFGRVVPLALVGIYGVARAIAEIPTTLARRLAYQLVFPALARSEGTIAAEVLTSRVWLVAAAGAGMGLAVGLADAAIALVYDPRYAAAGWMLALLLIAGLFSILSNLNEALLLAAGRPSLSTGANAAKFALLAVVLPLGHRLGGLPWAIGAIVLTEIGQYLFIAWGVRRVGGAVFRQDALALGLGALVLGTVTLLRLACGFGASFAGAWR